MQWDNSRNAGFSKAPSHSIYLPIIDDDTYGCHQVNVKAQRANPSSLWHSVQKMIHVRKEHPVFGEGDFEWIDCKNDAIAAYTRTLENETIYVFNNLSAGEQVISIPIRGPIQQLTDILTDTKYFVQSHALKLELGPRQFLWLVCNER